MTGYLHPNYAQSLAEFGIPCELPNAKGWILKRKIPGTNYYDAMGCYPLFCCHNWSFLNQDLNSIAKDLVSIYLVTDPFGNYDKDELKLCFPDTFYPYKEHFIIDLNQSPKEFICNHHQRYANKSFKEIEVIECETPKEYLEDWISLYSNLIQRHSITGLTKFSRESFTKQLSIPGIFTFIAIHQGVVIGIILWYINGKIGYYHLGAYNHLGYQKRAAFALFFRSIEYFKNNGLQWLNLGAGAGLKKNNLDDGLTRFKKGWSTETNITYFCGRIFDYEKYLDILSTKNIPNTNYFPAYRLGEFN